MARTPTERSRDSTAAAYAGWANTADRAARLANTHANSASGHVWHARRLFGADVDPESLTQQQWKQVDAARLAWLKANSIKAIKASHRRAIVQLGDRHPLRLPLRCRCAVRAAFWG